jgi:hypothetical protein
MKPPDKPPKTNKKRPVVPQLTEEEQRAVISGDDENGDAEANQLGSGEPEEDLKKAAKKKEHERTQAFKDHVERIAIAGVYVAAFCFAIISLAVLSHMILPKSNSWLTDQQFSDLNSLITGGIVAGVITSYFKKRL